MAEQKKRITSNPMLAAVLNGIGMVEIVILPVLLIAMIWVDETTLLKKLALSDFIAFVATLVIYWLCCYVPKEDE